MTIANPVRLMMAGNVLVAGLLLGGGLLLLSKDKGSPTATQVQPEAAATVSPMPYATPGELKLSEEPVPLMSYANESVPAVAVELQTETRSGSIDVTVRGHP